MKLSISSNRQGGAESPYHVISPEGLPVTSEPFESKAAAQAYIPEWCKGFEQQGYFATNDKKIPTSELQRHLIICPEDMVGMLPKGPDSLDGPMEELMAESFDAMNIHGKMKPVAYGNGRECEGPLLAPPFKSVEENKQFIDHVRLRSIATGSTSVVLACEAWMKIAQKGEPLNLNNSLSSDPQRKECLLFMGETPTVKEYYIFPIIRDEAGKITGYGNQVHQRSERSQAIGKFAELLPDEIPDKQTREQAKQILSQKEKARGRGLALGDD